MAKRNYSKMSTRVKPVVEEVSEPIVNDSPTVSNEPETVTPVIGKVTGCGKLNVRKEPKVTADVVCEVTNNSELMIDLSSSTEEWYSVCTAAGSEGFCMKKFIEIRQ